MSGVTSKNDLPLLRTLLEEQRVLSLALNIEGKPHASVLPFVSLPDFSGAVVHASGLARHSRGLVAGADFSAVIHLPDRPDVDPLQLPRLLVDGRVEPVPRESDEYGELRRLYQQRFPSSEITFSLPDFELHRLRFGRGRLVAGFARASSVSSEDFQRLTAD